MIRGSSASSARCQPRSARRPGADHLSVTAIAFASGFGDLSTFHSRFRARYGTTFAAARADR